jgi:hypothetical protein
MLTEVEQEHIMRVGWIVDHMLHYVRSNMAIYDELPLKKKKCLKHIISMSVDQQRHYIIVDDELVIAKREHQEFQYYHSCKRWREIPVRKDAVGRGRRVNRNLSEYHTKKTLT